MAVRDIRWAADQVRRSAQHTAARGAKNWRRITAGSSARHAAGDRLRSSTFRAAFCATIRPWTVGKAANSGVSGAFRDLNSSVQRARTRSISPSRRAAGAPSGPELLVAGPTPPAASISVREATGTPIGRIVLGSSGNPGFATT
ncbi:hypothetical protein CG736_00820 [Kitasatospora sp. CB02891]|nr:hypothetical protein CG736_00820 [Kitasatospora sp. CB02891]